MVDFALLEKLCMADSISGDEREVRKIILDEITPFADEITVDNLGNILVYKKGAKTPEEKLMLSAHMDEVGFMVTDITSDGYVKFDEVGGIDRRVVLGKSVTIGKNKVNGVVGIKPVHLSKGDDRSAIPSFSSMYIDIGATSRENALEYVKYGDSINFVSFYEKNDYTIKTKAIDDRFGCLVLIDMIKKDLPYDMYFTFVVQEEVGLMGAKTASYTVEPDYAIVVETTTAADVPNVEENKQVCNLLEGAVISVMDRRTIYDKRMVEMAFESAKKAGVKAQYKRAVAGGNDAGAIHQSRGGVRTLAVSLPCRYLHSGITVANVDDCQSVMDIVYDLSCRIANGEYERKESEQ